MPTPYLEVNEILRVLLADAQSVLSDQLVGMYLYGSLATGDFSLDSSDIDFVFVTKSELPDDMIAGLEDVHKRLWASGLKWAAKLEGTYTPQAALRRYMPDGPLCPCVNEGRFYLARYESDWVIQRQVLREKGVVVVGPPLAEMIDPVSPEDVRQGVRGILREWWRPMLTNTGWFADSAYQAYAVLTMCRALYTLEHGVIASKPVSAHWARGVLDKHWADLISWALAWTHDTAPEKFEETLAFIRFTLERVEKE